MTGAAYHIDSVQGADGLAVRVQEVPVPGPDEVVVRLRAASVNHRDLMLLDGSYAIPAKPGVIPLVDGAGEVVAVGRAVRRARIGDRVTATYFLGWVDGPLTRELASQQHGANHDGMLATYARLDQAAVVRIPSHLSFAEAATLTCAGVTAWAALNGPRPVTAGDTVLTVGTGPVGLFGLQLARDLGAHVIAVTSTRAKANRVRQLGAFAAVDREETPEWDKEVLELTDGRGVDHVVEAVGPATLERSLRCAGFNSHIAVIGLYSAGGLTLDDRTFAGRVFTLRRQAVGSRSDLEALVHALERHGTRPVIDRVFDFAETRNAYRHLQAGNPFGKVVISIP
jgi:NADPH:quinone reductase-like Zn-dependent oxidoreductase